MYNFRRNERLTKNKLSGQVVLLISDDSTGLADLVIQLARRGANIALFCRTCSSDAVQLLKQGVQALDQEILILQYADGNNTSDRDLIEIVTSDLGRPNFYIDLSGLEREMKNNSDSNQSTLQKWQLTRAILEELIVT